VRKLAALGGIRPLQHADLVVDELSCGVQVPVRDQHAFECQRLNADDRLLHMEVLAERERRTHLGHGTR
jgi:hypothetical protein